MTTTTEPATLDDALRAIRELRADVDRLTARSYEPQNDLEIDRLRVVGKTGVVEIGQLAPNYFGVRVTGRGTCTGLEATLGLDDGEHSLPVVPIAYVSVDGHGCIRSAASNVPMEAPSTLWLSPLGDRNEVTFRHGGYADGFIGAPLDCRGEWYGRLELAEGDDGESVAIEASLLDDMMRHGGIRSEGWWRTNEA